MDQLAADAGARAGDEPAAGEVAASRGARRSAGSSPAASPAGAPDAAASFADGALDAQSPSAPVRRLGLLAPDSAHGGSGQEEQEIRRDLAISGTVLDDAGQPLAGIAITAQALTPGLDAAVSGMSRTSNGLGMFSFAPLIEGEYRLSVPETAAYLGVNANVRAGMESVELRLQRQHLLRIAGTVTDPAGQPLAGVSISPLGEPQQSRSDDLGQYEIVAEVPRAGVAPVLRFSLAGFRELRQRVPTAMSLSGGEMVIVNVAMQPENSQAWVAGRILGPAGEAVGGASVVLQSPLTRDYHRIASGNDGSYRFDGVEAGAGYRLVVAAIGDYAAFRSEAFAVDERGATVDAVLDAIDFGTLSGHAVALDGSPLPGFALWLSSDSSRRGQPLNFRTDGAGRFEVEEVPAGTLRIETRSQPRLEVSGIQLRPGERKQVVVPLDWGSMWLLGQVVDETGAPVAGARVVLQWIYQVPELRSASRREVASDQQGFFAFSNLGGAPHTLTVEAVGFETARADVDPAQTSGDVRIALKRALTGEGAGR